MAFDRKGVCVREMEYSCESFMEEKKRWMKLTVEVEEKYPSMRVSKNEILRLVE